MFKWLFLGWKFNDGNSWVDNGITLMPIDDVNDLLCGDITVTVRGNTRVSHSLSGMYSPTGGYHAGRQIFLNSETGLYLSVLG